jgi:hypothetical protein
MSNNLTTRTRNRWLILAVVVAVVVVIAVVAMYGGGGGGSGGGGGGGYWAARHADSGRSDDDPHERDAGHRADQRQPRRVPSMGLGQDVSRREVEQEPGEGA